MQISRSELIETLAYDPETGDFHWRKPRKGVVPGRPAGTTDRDGYRVIWIRPKRYFAHRLAWLYAYGDWPKGVIDHKDRNTGNNRLSNLRDCTVSENAQNRVTAEKRNKTGVLGVSPQGALFIATICVAGKDIYLGHFRTVGEASAAYQAAKLIHHPFAAAAA